MARSGAGFRRSAPGGGHAAAMAAPTSRIRIFLSSPGDVAAERDAAAALAEALNGDAAPGFAP